MTHTFDHHPPCPGGCGELADECRCPKPNPLGSMLVDRDADNVPGRVMRCDDPEAYVRGYNAGYADAHRHGLADGDELDDLIERGGCTLAPEGWWCSLPEGHDGPCPARPEPMPTDRASGTIPNEAALRGERDAAYADAAYAEECARTALDRAEAAEAELASEGAQHQETRQDFDALRAEVERLRISPDRIEELLGIDPNDPLHKLAAEVVRLRATIARVEALADWFERQENWRAWNVHGQIRAALRGPAPTEGPFAGVGEAIRAENERVRVDDFQKWVNDPGSPKPTEDGA